MKDLLKYIIEAAKNMDDWNNGEPDNPSVIINLLKSMKLVKKNNNFNYCTNTTTLTAKDLQNALGKLNKVAANTAYKALTDRVGYGYCVAVVTDLFDGTKNSWTINFVYGADNYEITNNDNASKEIQGDDAYLVIHYISTKNKEAMKVMTSGQRGANGYKKTTTNYFIDPKFFAEVKKIIDSL